MYESSVAAKKRHKLVFVICAAALAGGLWLYLDGDTPALYTYEVVRTFDHDPNAFTQGLAFDEGRLYEGTGLYGGSSLRKVDLESGRVIERRPLPPAYFGEGLTVLGNRILQLTYRSRVILTYDKETFELMDTADYPYEGWGLTHDGEHLIASDGSHTLHFLDRHTFRVIRHLPITYQGEPVHGLNELEYVKGSILANVWLTNRIARIDPQTGRVTAWIDLAGLRPQRTTRHPDAVLNGIAYDAENDRLFVTGKLWPSLFQIECVEKR